MTKLGLATALLAASSTTALGAGIERSVPSTSVLFEDGRYLQFSFSTADPTLSGVGGALDSENAGTGDLLERFATFGAAYKADINENLSYAFILDEPVGVDTNYPVIETSGYSGTVAELNGLQLTSILAYRPATDVTVYGGVRVQAIDANATLPFIAAPAGYSVDAARDIASGYMFGAAYERPDIALRVALTYYSAIDHELATTEVIPGSATVDSTVEISTPQSVNLEFQSGIAEDTLLFGSIRWVDWSEFAISPTLFSSDDVAGQPLVDYQEDWTTYTLGVGRRFNETWSGAIQVSHEPAAGYVPLTTLGPVDGRNSIGVAATYTKDNMKITAGVTYVDLGETQNFAATDFSDGDAIGFGFRVGYTF